jgi:hypothetical protein
MKKLLLILSAIVFLFGCKKEQDPRDKYVGHYVGLLVPYGYYTVPNEDGQFAELYLSKHAIDNVLIAKCNSHPPIVGSTNFNTNSFGDLNTDYDDEFELNRIYVSDKGFIYRKNMFYEDLYYTKLCRFVEPDSIYCLVYFLHNPAAEFYIKAKKVD